MIWLSIFESESIYFPLLAGYLYRESAYRTAVDFSSREAGAVILKISHGYTIEPHERDPLVDLVTEAMDQFGQAAVPGAWLVDLIPLREYPSVLN